MIELINDLWVKAETLNYTLLLDTKAVNKEGETIYKPLAYVSTLEQAVRTARDYSIKNKLSKTNEEGFKSIREDYNNGNKSWDMFYSMLVHSFNNQIRFNKKGQFNVPIGIRDFNPNLEKNFIKFINKLSELNIYFFNNDFSKLIIDTNKLEVNDFVYCDPPYLITCASYNESNKWNETKENQLLNLLDSLNKNNIKFAMSNVLENKGKSNNILKEWSNKYNIHHLNNIYGNCNCHAKDKSRTSTDEVLITNY